MSRHGKWNLLGIVILPAIAVIGALIVFGSRFDTLLFVLGTNALPMLIGGLISALLLRLVSGAESRVRFMAIWPTLLPAAFGIYWYVAGLAMAGPDAGREYFAGPFYLVFAVVLSAVVALVGCLVARRSMAGG
jgi:hypothetical protein